MEMGMVSRADRRHYLNTGTEAAPVWVPVGEGFTSFVEEKNPIRHQRRYIHEKVRRTDVTGYATAIEYAFELYGDNPVMEKLRQITDEEKIGRDSWVEVCTVDLFAETDTSGVYRAVRRTWAVVPDRCGEGCDGLLYGGTLRAVSAPVTGVFVVSSGTFMK